MANNIGAATIDLRHLAESLAQSSDPRAVTAMAQPLVKQAAQQVQMLAQLYAPVRTGALRGGIVIEFKNDGLEAFIYPTSPYAVYMEYGTGSRGEYPGAPYVITPKRAKALRFKVGGRVVYAKRVVHPGVAPRPFMRPAAERAFEGLPKDLGDAAVKYLINTPATQR